MKMQIVRYRIKRLFIKEKNLELFFLDFKRRRKWVEYRKENGEIKYFYTITEINDLINEIYPGRVAFFKRTIDF